MEFIEEPIHNFHKYYYIPTIDRLVFHLAHVHILGKNECISTIKEATRSHQKYRYIKLGKYYPKKYSDSTSLQIQSQHWGDEHQLSLEGVDLDHFHNFIIVGYYYPSSTFYS